MTLSAFGLLIVSVLGLVYAWIGYPLLLRRRGRRWSLITMTRNHEESVSIVIPAFNKEAVILRKLRNTLSLDYPAELMEILVVADGCTDRTEELVRSVKDPRVRLVSLPRGGKISSLQQAVLRSRGEILVFTEATVALERQALRNLIRNFADWHVGGASGALRVRRRRNGDALGLGEAMFTRYDAAIRKAESLLGSVHSADSSLYAIRRALFRAPRNMGLADDLAISSRVVLAGKRLVHEPRAICRRDAPVDGAREMRRKMHQANYTLRSVLDLKWKLLRQRGYAAQLLSHTVARLLSPIWILTAIGASTVLAMRYTAFVPVLVAEVLLVTLAVAGWLLRARDVGRSPYLALPAWFLGLNVAYFFGVYGTFAGRKPVGATPRKMGLGSGATETTVVRVLPVGQYQRTTAPPGEQLTTDDDGQANPRRQAMR